MSSILSMLSYIDHAKFDYFMLSFSQGQLQNEQSSNFLAIALLIHSDHSFYHIFVSITLMVCSRSLIFVIKFVSLFENNIYLYL